MTNPICWTCKNCSYGCAADCGHCHTTQHGVVLIIFPLNLQTITITRMLSSGVEGVLITEHGEPITLAHTHHVVAPFDSQTARLRKIDYCDAETSTDGNSNGTPHLYTTQLQVRLFTAQCICQLGDSGWQVR